MKSVTWDVRFYRAMKAVLESRVGPFTYATPGPPALKAKVEARIAARDAARKARGEAKHLIP